MIRTADTHKKDNHFKKMRVSKKGSAKIAIGKLEKNTDTFILTNGQFSLIDALVEILAQTGRANVTLSTWTAAHAHLDKSEELMNEADINSFRMIVDRSFRTRQPKYFEHMIKLFGQSNIREISTHAKYMLIRNKEWDIVVRTSMNLNENPRLENIEISDNFEFAEFFQRVSDDIFNEFKEGESSCSTPKLESICELPFFKPVTSGKIKQHSLNEARYETVI